MILLPFLLAASKRDWEQKGGGLIRMMKISNWETHLFFLVRIRGKEP
jgi:hypothetical protein